MKELIFLFLLYFYLFLQIERERMLHVNELRELEDEIDNLKNLISRLQLNYESKVV